LGLESLKRTSEKKYMKAIGYARVSTLEQGEAGVSLENQRERIVAWCVAAGFALDRVYVETMSGARAANRPVLQEALAAVCREKGVLVVYSLSRLARSVRDTLDLAERLERSGANLASLSERIDTSSAVGKMVFRMLSTLNEFERDQLAERTESAMAHLRRNGRRISGRVPFGYDLGRISRQTGRNRRFWAESLSFVPPGLPLPGLQASLQPRASRPRKAGHGIRRP
jgi:site-specific DNA recombinase